MRAPYNEKLIQHITAPDTGPESAVRDDEGRLIGVRRFRSRI